MTKPTLFNRISEREKQAILTCFQPQRRTFTKGETILTYSPAARHLGVILSGSAVLRCIDTEGQQSTLELLEENDAFGEIFLPPSRQMEYYVEAQVNTCILFIDYCHIIKRCEKACSHHSQLVSNLFQIAAAKAQAQSVHINILSQRSTRKRLIAYFDMLSQQNDHRYCILPMSYSSLAEYICADRSAMMRELKKMKEEGIIKTAGRQIHLLDNRS